MADALLTLNAGSSSIKFALFPLEAGLPGRPALSGQIDGLGHDGAVRPHIKARDAAGRSLDDVDLDLPASGQHHAALELLLRWLHDHENHGAGRWRVAGIGHRVVHGGRRYSQPTRVDPATVEALKRLIPLAPLHQPHNIAGIETMTAALPGVPQVACFDTAFHRSQPELAQRYALPRRLTDEGVRRYGFHGLSYEYIAESLPQHMGDGADGRIVVAHLGNGASMCAMHRRRSIATTMGFTALEGLVMGTRAGSLDPGVLLYLMDNDGLDSAALANLLYKESGLLGVSGISQDMRELLASNRPEAREAIDLFCYRIVREIGSLTAALGGLDALVFTGGIGEHAAPVRQLVCRDCGWLGVTLDAAANAVDAVRISTPASRVAVLALPTNEEWMIARHTLALIV